ncbi:MAG: aromatic ring-hydroxylating dioxygenase subunit alpha [Acidimicrobiia bacterium]|nr:aromatic ring-hydroxylating dioxygenase subunit alpha [Acidimicrobiia bacterium]
MAITDARSPGLTYHDLLDADTHGVNPTLRLDSVQDLGDHDIPVERYISREFHDLEVEKIWKRVWQMACREEDIPNVGDTVRYDIADISIVVLRSAPGEIKAFYNACLHRGRLLREEDGYCGGDTLRCPFHGFAWHLDGSLAEVPAAWDFPHVDPEADKWQLPEVMTSTWGGWVFVNMDPGAEPLADFIGDLAVHFDKWAQQDKYKSAHVARVFRCNWKVVQEAFSEAFHVSATHPQILVSIGDQNTKYDTWENFSRAISPGATPSPHLTWEPTEQDVFDALTDRRVDQEPVMEVPPGSTARAVAASLARDKLRSILGDEVETYCDAEMTDSIYYTLFPNFHPWAAFNRINYRFRPYGNDPDMSIMECVYLDPFEGERPPPAKITWLGPDDSWVEKAPELGNLARVFEQDTFNLPKVQAGLHTTQRSGVTLANYQESKIRHIHSLIDRWIAKP